MKSDSKLFLLNISGIYEHTELYKSDKTKVIELKDIEGTNCYCDTDAEKEIGRRLMNHNRDSRGIHLIDSGNYHYISKLWIEKISEPFTLIMFDNHTDMQPSAFGEILSCGGWLRTALHTIPALEKVILIGPDQKAFDETEFTDDSRICFLSREILQNDGKEEWIETIMSELSGHAVYISIDKDVLNTDDAKTSWSQGDMKLGTLKKFLNRFSEEHTLLIGADICGESEKGDPDQLVNDRTNLEILTILKRCMIEE